MYTFSEPIRREGGTAPFITTLGYSNAVHFQSFQIRVMSSSSRSSSNTYFVFNHSICIICFENGLIISFIYFGVQLTAV